MAEGLGTSGTLKTGWPQYPEGQEDPESSKEPTCPKSHSFSEPARPQGYLTPNLVLVPGNSWDAGHKEEVDCALDLSQVALAHDRLGLVRGGSLTGERSGD